MVLEYITTRTLENSKGEVKGKIRILKMKEELKASVEYTCPECNFSEKRKELWKKPFSIRCSRCNFLIKVPSLRAEIKKKRKK
jgi:ssDNA-binding Zn-finger/Zn-ribbon topoisomerase 1